jgi:signal transduction histidine kinase
MTATEFLRDPELFTYLRARVLPEMIARARTQDHELRLWFCKELVTAHGGCIDVRSTEGEGTTFTVWLPLLHNDQA